MQDGRCYERGFWGVAYVLGFHLGAGYMGVFSTLTFIELYLLYVPFYRRILYTKLKQEAAAPGCFRKSTFLIAT